VECATRRYEHASTVLTSNKGFEEWGEIFGDDVMPLIDRLVHHCHLVTIRGNSYRMRQHTELWNTLHAEGADERAAGRRRRARQESRRTEARPLVDLSDFHPAELSDFRPALTPKSRSSDSGKRTRVQEARRSLRFAGILATAAVPSSLEIVTNYSGRCLIKRRTVETDGASLPHRPTRKLRP
jgi:hypothetical protein